MNNTSVTIEYTLTVKTCLEQVAEHLRVMEVEPRPVIVELFEDFESKVTEFPLGCHICPELLKIGVAKYRECNTKGGYRVLYSVEENIVTAHAILSQKQDIKLLLFKRLIQA